MNAESRGERSAKLYQIAWMDQSRGVEAGEWRTGGRIERKQKWFRVAKAAV